MFCPNCGTNNIDEAAFCKNCGASLLKQQNQAETSSGVNNDTDTFNAEQPQKEPNNQGFQQQQYQQNNYQQQNYQQNYYQNYQQAYVKKEKIYSSNPVINAVKKAASSGVFLAGTICFSVYVLFQFISLFSGSVYMATVMDILQASGIPYEEYYAVQTAFSSFSWLIIVAGLIGMAPTILALLGSWLTFGAGKKVNEPGMDTKGITLIKVITVISFVFYCISMGIAVLMMIFAIILMASLPSIAGSTAGVLDYDAYAATSIASGVFVFVFVIALLVIAGMAVVNILFYTKGIKTLNSVKASVENGKVMGDISMYFIVMLFIYGGLSVFSGWSGFIMAASYILFAVALINLRSDLKKIEETQMQNQGYNPNMNYQPQQIPNNNF